MALATEALMPRPELSDTQFARPYPEFDIDGRVRSEDQELSGGTAFIRPDPAEEQAPWRGLFTGERIFYIPAALLQEPPIFVSDVDDATWIPNAPLSDPARTQIQRHLHKLVERSAALWAAIQSATDDAPAVVLDVPTQLQEARVQAGLPVQDLAAMFGVKRRQFYNLMNGDTPPSLETERRITPVAESIRRLSQAAAGDGRTARSAILASIEGDTLFDAAASADAERLAAATSRAIDAVVSDERLRKGLPPSHRATKEAVKATREELSLSRDQMGFSSDGS